MALTLRIENEAKLPDGGPVSITVTGRRSIDIGRDTHLDWTLPDPSRHISGKHCEVRYREGDPFQSPPPLQPNPFDSALRAASSVRSLDPDGWAAGPRTPGPPVPEPPPPVPAPRRRTAGERQETWDGPAPTQETPFAEPR